MNNEYYEDVYKKRLNRFGDDYSSRIQGKRQVQFQRNLEKSVYYVTFVVDNRMNEGELIPKSQNDTKALQTLLTAVPQPVKVGTIIDITDMKGDTTKWLVYYENEVVARGYNSYTVLRMTHNIKWTNRDQTTGESWGYFYGQEDNMLKNDIKSRSRMNTIYSENLKMSFFIMPLTDNIKTDSYMEVEDQTHTIVEPFRVTGMDRQSSEGVMYVTVDPVYEFDKTGIPEKTETDNDDDFFWLTGGEDK